MPLAPGTRFGPYDVIAQIGAGAMGEVYRARDTRLRRDVALKTIAAPLAANPDSRARFEREAQALASLSHPHIALIYGIEERVSPDDGVPVCALALEFVDGETLADRIALAPIPLHEVLALARQIAEALEAAHEQGIVHRDLKPANIKITPGGMVKVLDFGLARMRGEQTGASSASLGSSLAPTISLASPTLTQAGTVLGTAAYMAPEQARGRPADRRADVWAFGAVLYEMLTRRRAFEGETLTEVAGAVIHREVDWTALPTDTPAHVRVVLDRCLQKDPRDRLRDMGDVRLALDGALTPRGTAIAAAPPVPRLRRVGELAAAALAAVLLTLAAGWMTTGGDVPAVHPVRFLLPPVPGALGGIPSLSPDGRFVVAYVRGDEGMPRLWLYTMASGEWRMLTGEAIDRFTPPFWSPDSRSLAFVSGGSLRRIAVAGGPAEVVARLDANVFAGGAWTSDGAMLLATVGGSTPGIAEIPASGGEPVPLTRLAPGAGVHQLPSLLPDGRHFLYFRGGDSTTAGIYVGARDRRPDEQDDVRLLATSEGAVFVPGERPRESHLLFLREGILMAQPFDARSRQVAGEPAAVLDAPVVGIEGFGLFWASRSGTLAYIAGDWRSRSAVWVAPDGTEERIAEGLTDIRNPRLSPDGRSLALVVNNDIWRYELDGRPPMRLTSGVRTYSPLWTPDGARIVYEQDGAQSLMIVAADGSVAPEPLGPEGHFHPQAFTPGGDELIVVRMPGQRAELMALSMEAPADLRLISTATANEGLNGAAVSSDGRWLAYTSDVTGRAEIWVRPVRGGGAGVRVSPAGGIEPVWGRRPGELYYLDDSVGQNVMQVSVRPGTSFDFTPPVPVLRADIVPEGPPNYDVGADGRLLLIRPSSDVAEQISVVLNWRELLARRNRDTR